MSLYDFIKNIFGFPRPYTPVDPSISGPNNGSEFKKPVWIDEYVEEDDDILSPQQSAPMFPVMSDLLEIHRYFEQQMEYMREMMRHSSGFSRSSIFDENHPKMFGTIEPPVAGSGNLRDEYLKHPDGTNRIVREDTDLDSRVGAEGLGGIMNEPFPEKHNVPAIPAPKFHFFGESIITKTVRKPDGTLETRTTKRHSDGTEETVVSMQKPEDTETGLPPRDGTDPFSGRSDDRFLIDIFDSFFRKD